MDYSVLLFHGRDHIQKYLLTLMNIVSGNTDSQLRDKVNHREDSGEKPRETSPEQNQFNQGCVNIAVYPRSQLQQLGGRGWIQLPKVEKQQKIYFI